MRVLSVSWSPNSDITKLKFSDEFLSSDWIVRADVLKDLIQELVPMYNGMMTPKGMEEMRTPKGTEA
tara:strand:- start:102 stop:302 length:201 start_codon:yes stop_codon:yes gene_type:complete